MRSLSRATCCAFGCVSSVTQWHKCCESSPARSAYRARHRLLVHQLHGRGRATHFPPQCLVSDYVEPRRVTESRRVGSRHPSLFCFLNLHSLVDSVTAAAAAAVAAHKRVGCRELKQPPPRRTTPHHTTPSEHGFLLLGQERETNNVCTFGSCFLLLFAAASGISATTTWVVQLSKGGRYGEEG